MQKVQKFAKIGKNMAKLCKIACTPKKLTQLEKICTDSVTHPLFASLLNILSPLVWFYQSLLTKISFEFFFYIFPDNNYLYFMVTSNRNNFLLLTSQYQVHWFPPSFTPTALGESDRENFVTFIIQKFCLDCKDSMNKSVQYICQTHMLQFQIQQELDRQKKLLYSSNNQIDARATVGCSKPPAARWSLVGLCNTV